MSENEEEVPTYDDVEGAADENESLGSENYSDDEVEEVEDVPDPELRTTVIPVPGGLGSGSGNSIDDILAIMHKSGIQGYSVNATNPAGYMGPRHAADGGYHQYSMAVDLGGNGSAAVRDQVAKFWYQFTPNILELIHSHTPGSPYSGWYVKNGRVVRPYGPASQHYNHVHIAIRESAAKAILAKLNSLHPAIPPKPTGVPSRGIVPYMINGVDVRLLAYDKCPRICPGTGGKNSPPSEAAWVGYFIKLFVKFSPYYWNIAVQRGTKVLNYKEADNAFLGAVAQMAHDYKLPWHGCIDSGIWDIYQPHTSGSRAA